MYVYVYIHMHTYIYDIYIYIYIYLYTYILKGLRPMPPTRTLNASRPQTDSVTSGVPDTKDVINQLSGHTLFGQLGC